MRSVFEVQAFGRRGIPASGMVPLRLGQADQTAPATPPTDTSGMAGQIEYLLKQLPPELLGTYDAKYKACQAKLETGGAVGIVAGAKCLEDLYAEIKNVIKNGPPPKPAAPAVASDTVLPVVVGVVGLLVLVWGLSKL